LRAAYFFIARDKGQITSEEFLKIEAREKRPLSLHSDLNWILYLGIVLISTAVGILIYKNIDTIGHSVLVVVLGILIIACFSFCLVRSHGYRHTKIIDNSIWSDYILLAGCLLLLILIGYLQFQFNVFGNRWGLALFIPAVLLFLSAYYFDHLGVLSLAITTLAAWAGVAVTPTKLLKNNDWSNETIMYTSLVLSIFFITIAILSNLKNIKAHFAFTYQNFGLHLFYLATVSLILTSDHTYLLWFAVIITCGYFLFKNALAQNSFYLVLVNSLYLYIVLCIVVMRLLWSRNNDPIYLSILYFIITGFGYIFFLIHFNKKLKGYERISGKSNV
jgi:hypothetical protein